MLIKPFPSWAAAIGLKGQYDRTLKLYRRLGLVERRPCRGHEGLLRRDAWWPMLTLRGVIERFEKRGDIARKVEQGFVSLVIEPFALSIESLAAAYGKLLLEKHAAGRLLGADGTKLELNVDEPVWVWYGYADEADWAYRPKRFSRSDHGGVSKQELLDRKGGWQVYLVEEGALPRAGQGITAAGRKQIEAGLTGHEYLELLQEGQHVGEELLSPEAGLARAISRLDVSDIVTGDWKGGDCDELLGAYHRTKGIVSAVDWSRGRYDRRAGVGRCDPGYSSAYQSARVGVRGEP